MIFGNKMYLQTKILPQMNIFLHGEYPCISDKLHVAACVLFPGLCCDAHSETSLIIFLYRNCASCSQHAFGFIPQSFLSFAVLSGACGLEFLCRDHNVDSAVCCLMPSSRCCGCETCFLPFPAYCAFCFENDIVKTPFCNLFLLMFWTVWRKFKYIIVY